MVFFARIGDVWKSSHPAIAITPSTTATLSEAASPCSTIRPPLMSSPGLVVDSAGLWEAVPSMEYCWRLLSNQRVTLLNVQHQHRLHNLQTPATRQLSIKAVALSPRLLPENIPQDLPTR